MNKDPRVYLAQIVERAQRIADYISGGREAFMQDERTQDAVIRNFEVIGEAAKRVPDWYRVQHPSIPWKLMSGFRDVLIHAYDSVDPERVWHAASVDLPPVHAAVRAMLPPLDTLEREVAGDPPE